MLKSLKSLKPLKLMLISLLVFPLSLTLSHARSPKDLDFEIENLQEYQDSVVRMLNQNITAQTNSKQIPLRKEIEFSVRVLSDACARSVSPKICFDSLLSLSTAIGKTQTCFDAAAQISLELGRQKRFLEKELDKYRQPL